MNKNGELPPRSVGNNSRLPALAGARLKQLRRERFLIERAIVALTKISAARLSRSRRAIRGL